MSALLAGWLVGWLPLDCQAWHLSESLLGIHSYLFTFIFFLYRACDFPSMFRYKISQMNVRDKKFEKYGKKIEFR